nr:hypothetical protein [Hyphomonas sp. Mor2]
MTHDRVLELIEAFGAEPMGWPEQDREAARAILESDPDAFTEALAEARALDAALALDPMPEPSAQLADAILAAAPRAPRARSGVFGGLSSLLFPQGVRWPAGAALASLLMGLVGGYAYASTGAGYDQADSAYYAAFGFDNGAEWGSLE